MIHSHLFISINTVIRPLIPVPHSRKTHETQNRTAQPGNERDLKLFLHALGGCSIGGKGIL